MFRYFGGSLESFRRDELQRTLANPSKANSLLTTSKQEIEDQKNRGSKDLRRLGFWIYLIFKISRFQEHAKRKLFFNLVYDKLQFNFKFLIINFKDILYFK